MYVVDIMDSYVEVINDDARVYHISYHISICAWKVEFPTAPVFLLIHFVAGPKTIYLFLGLPESDHNSVYS